MRRRPAFAFFIPLEHGEICDPQKAEFATGKRAMFGRILLSQRDPQQTRRVVDRMIVLLDFRLHASLRFVLSWLSASGNNDDQIAGLAANLFHNFSRGIRKILFQPFEVFE